MATRGAEEFSDSGALKSRHRHAENMPLLKYVHWNFAPPIDPNIGYKYQIFRPAILQPLIWLSKLINMEYMYNTSKFDLVLYKFLEKDIINGCFWRVLHSNFAPLQTACTQILSPLKVLSLKFPPPLDSSAPWLP